MKYLVPLLLVLAGCEAIANTSPMVLVSEDVLSMLHTDFSVKLDYFLYTEDSQKRGVRKTFVGTFMEGEMMSPAYAELLLTISPALLFGSFDTQPSQNEMELYSPILVYTSIIPVVHQRTSWPIATWDDLLAEDVQLVTIDFRYSSIGFFLYLNLWEYALDNFNNDMVAAKNFIVEFIERRTIFAISVVEAHEIFYLYNAGNVLLTVDEESHQHISSTPIEPFMPAFINLYQRSNVKRK